MDFDEAIKAHSSWKLKLSMYLKNPDQSLNHAEVRLDNKCPLGKWIHSEAKEFSHLKEYETLKKEHARFHEAAAEVIKKSDMGLKTSEEIAIGSQSPFNSASTAVIQAIGAIRRKV